MTAKKTKCDMPSLKTGLQMLEHLSCHPRGQVFA